MKPDKEAMPVMGRLSYDVLFANGFPMVLIMHSRVVALMQPAAFQKASITPLRLMCGWQPDIISAGS